MDAQDYIDRIARGRGSVSEFHSVMAKQDFEVLQATDSLTRTAILQERRLEKTTKELLFIVTLVALRGAADDIRMHMRFALGMGVEPLTILEALEMLIPLGGVVLFKEGFELWREVTEADGVAPSADAVSATR